MKPTCIKIRTLALLLYLDVLGGAGVLQPAVDGRDDAGRHHVGLGDDDQ